MSERKRTPKQQLFEDAVNHWGLDAQFAMVVEECAELIHAIQKANRKTNHESYTERTSHIIEESVDVGLMLEQVKAMIPSPLWKQLRAKKILRLRNLLRISQIQGG